MQTALEKMTALWYAGKPIEAMHMAAKWHMLGRHKEAISRGSAAARRPEFYVQLNQDPAAHVEAGLVAMSERYSLPLTKHGETV
jgi:hypothetical protein